jgi:predicted AAA+ superfamily ATPase
MDRDALGYLMEWRDRIDRRPLVIRGARQVGKSFLVRMFASDRFENMLEVNFENEPTVAGYFGKSEVSATVSLLEAHYRRQIVPGKTLLFLDEVQAAPGVFGRLRYFYEQMPDLHVIAAGSLLDFALEDHCFSMPVGRVEYFHLGPFRFGEFLRSLGENGLHGMITEYSPGQELPVGIHERLRQCLKVFLAVGGMPESVVAYIRDKGFRGCDRILQGILQTFSDDFSKYGNRVNREHLLTVFRALPRLIGGKLKYVNISKQIRSADIAKSLHMLELAGVVRLVHHTAGQGLPLAASENRKLFKPLFLDVGLTLSALGLGAADLERTDLMLINSGAVCEQFVGQHLFHRHPPYRLPELHYWVREEPSASAEVDYLISIGTDIVPVEVKGGKTGTLRSLHQFMITHQSPLAIRFNLDLPSLTQVEGQLPTGARYSYPLLSLPLYMVEETERLVRLIRGKA